MDISMYYESTELPIAEIATLVNKPFKQVYNYIRATYSYEYQQARKRLVYRNSKLGDKNPQKRLLSIRKKDRVSDTKGYWMVLKPEWYTGRKGSKHIFEHHYVVCKELSLTEIPRNWCVHHCDHDPNNNSFDNLVLLTNGSHSSLHQSGLKGGQWSKEDTLAWLQYKFPDDNYRLAYSLLGK